MDTIKMFMEAGAALQNDPLYTDLINAKNLNDADEELQKQIGEFNLAKIAMNTAIGAEEQDEEGLAALNADINRLYEEIMNNESMVAYNDAKVAIDELLQHVNAIVMAAVNGENPMEVTSPSQQSACSSGGCSSCSGCH